MWLPGQQINSCCPVWGKCTYSPLPVIQLHIEPPVYFSAVSQWLWIRSLNCRQRIEILLNVWGMETDSSLPPGCARSSGRDASWKLPGVITVHAALLLLDFWGHCPSQKCSGQQDCLPSSTWPENEAVSLLALLVPPVVVWQVLIHVLVCSIMCQGLGSIATLLLSITGRAKGMFIQWHVQNSEQHLYTLHSHLWLGTSCQPVV